MRKGKCENSFKIVKFFYFFYFFNFFNFTFLESCGNEYDKELKKN